MHIPALRLPISLGPTTLRPLRHEDIPKFAAYRSDPLLAQYQSWEPMSLAQAAGFVEATAGVSSLSLGQWIQLAIADTETDHLIGDLGVFLDAHGLFAEVGFTLASAHHGQGHATRAVSMAVADIFEIESVSEVRAVTDQLNSGSVAVLERARFRYTSSQAVVFKGKSCVELRFTRFRSAA